MGREKFSDKKSLDVKSGLNDWVAGYLQFRMEAPFPENFVENVLGEILFRIGWGEDRVAFGNCGGNSIGEFRDFEFDGLRRRDIWRREKEWSL